MEVHAHTHTARKKWTHYFWEFLMLFLAVFCGFLAEYQLEHKIEKDREKVFIKNMYKDLIADTAIFRNYSIESNEFAKEVDSLLFFMKGDNRDLHVSKIYFYARNLTISTNNVVFPSQPTYNQLKHSGQLRLIHNQDVANTISSYYQETDIIYSQNNFILGQVSHYWDLAGNLFDAGVFYKIRQEKKPPDQTNLKLLTNDPAIINKFLVSSQYYYGSRMTQKDRVEKMIDKAVALMALIKKKYDLK
jgi:hypothetical protein